MTQLKTFRCWYHDGSARLLDAPTAKDAALEAQERAGLENADMVRGPEWRKACKVAKVECLSDPTVKTVKYKL